MASSAATTGHEDRTTVELPAPSEPEGVDMSPAIAVEARPNMDDVVPAPLPIINDDHPVDMPRIDDASDGHNSDVISSNNPAETEDIDGIDLQNAIAGLGYGGTFGPDDQPQSRHSDIDRDGASPTSDVLQTGRATTAPNADDTFALPLDYVQADTGENVDHDHADAEDNADDRFSENGDDVGACYISANHSAPSYHWTIYRVSLLTHR